jgi:3'-phosphoadenosine 5'-phosphosulfate sulfotransferase (PAPS reductase)/FAD synthetase
VKRILSLGAGVQSTTVLLMSCKGVLPKLDMAIFADTGWEPPAVYEHLAWLEREAALNGIPVHRVSKSNIRSSGKGTSTRYAGFRWKCSRHK